jgi:ribose 5-phosphate isomerase B
MKIIVGSDHFGYRLKADIVTYLARSGNEVVDAGCDSDATPVDYPDVAVAVAERIAQGEFDRAILICGTGIGMAMVANKVPGVRAACAHDPYSAERARKSNDAQVLALGAQIVGAGLAHSLVDIWLASEFQGGRSAAKVEKIRALDERTRRGVGAND